MYLFYFLLYTITIWIRNPYHLAAYSTSFRLSCVQRRRVTPNMYIKVMTISSIRSECYGFLVRIKNRIILFTLGVIT